MPTPKGYRMFVDSLLAVRAYQLDANYASDLQPVAEPARAVNAAAALLSNLTQFAGVVLTPKRSQVFRQIEFIRLSDRRVLLIIVTPDGDVQNRILSVQRDYGESELLEAANFFNVHFSGKSFDAGAAHPVHRAGPAARRHLQAHAGRRRRERRGRRRRRARWSSRASASCST